MSVKDIAYVSSPNGTVLGVFLPVARVLDVAPVNRRFNPIPETLRKRRFTNNKYSDYGNPDFVSLIDHLKKLPTELRQKIYRGITFEWHPLHPYHVTKSIHGLIGIARRNAIPAFTDKEVKTRCGPDTYPQAYAILFHRGSKSWLPKADGVESAYADNCGELDYYKATEHQNTIDFCKALKAYEANKPSTVDEVGVLRDFVGWFWDNNVVDLKGSWAHLPDQFMFQNGAAPSPGLDETSMVWLQSHPQYHEHIKHLSMKICFGLLVDWDWVEIPSRISLLSKGCEFISKHLINLKSVLLFVTISDRALDAVLKTPEACTWINMLRLIRPKNKFEVRYGLDRISEADKEAERNEQHLEKERRLEDLLKSKGDEKKDSEECDKKVDGNHKA